MPPVKLFRLMSALLLFLFRIEEAIAERSKNAAYQRSYDEYPYAGQSFAADEKSRAEGTGRVDGSAGEVDAEDVYEGKGKTDYKACYAAVFDLRGDAEDGKDEDEGQDDFNKQGKPDIAVVESVCSETGAGSYKSEKNRSAGDGAEELGNDVADEVSEGKLAVYEHCDGNGGVNVATGNIAYGIGHGDDHESECECGRKISNIRACRAALKDSRCSAGK